MTSTGAATEAIQDCDLFVSLGTSAVVYPAAKLPQHATANGSPPEPATRPPLTVFAFGMQLHAATTVDGRDRKQLERLCRYMLHPPFAHDAVQALPDGRGCGGIAKGAAC